MRAARSPPRRRRRGGTLDSSPVSRRAAIPGGPPSHPRPVPPRAPKTPDTAVARLWGHSRPVARQGGRLSSPLTPPCITAAVPPQPWPPPPPDCPRRCSAAQPGADVAHGCGPPQWPWAGSGRAGRACRAWRWEAGAVSGGGIGRRCGTGNPFSTPAPPAPPATLAEVVVHSPYDTPPPLLGATPPPPHPSPTPPSPTVDPTIPGAEGASPPLLPVPRPSLAPPPRRPARGWRSSLLPPSPPQLLCWWWK